MVDTTEKVHFNEAAYRGINPHLTTFQGAEEDQLPPPGLPLHQVFNKDTLNGLAEDFAFQAMELDDVTPSLWSRITSWWEKPKTAPLTQVVVQPAEMEKSPLAASMEPINSVPAIDPPDHIAEDLLEAELPPISKKTPLKSSLTSGEMSEALALMSQQTIEAVMFIIYKAQIELEKDNAYTTEGTFSKYLAYQKKQQEVLQEIKDVLVKDENVANKLATAQNITAAAAIISGVAAAAMSFGLLGPVGGFVGAALGQTAAGLFMGAATAIGTYGPAVTAGLTGLTLGSKAYFKRRTNEDKAKHEEFSFKDKYYNDRLEDMRTRLTDISQKDDVFKENWIRSLKRWNKLIQLLSKKNN